MNEALASDIPRLFTAVAEWGSCLVFVLIAGRRFGRWATVGCAIAALVALAGVQWWAGTLPLALWIPGMLVAIATMFAFIYLALSISAITAWYLTARAFVLAELAASAHWQLDRFYWPDASPVAQTLGMIAVYGVVLTIAWAAERRHFPRDVRFEASVGELISAGAIAAATFALSNLSFVDAETAFSGRWGPEIFYIRTLVDLAGYIALYVQLEVRRSLDARREAESMSRLLASQHDQYEISRRAIDEVNRKYHDMKHHLDAIRAEPDPTLRQQFLDDLEQSITDYGTQVRSGHPVLDAVLTAKHMQAREKGIDLTVVADGALLTSLRPLDITAIVGNALDNAIEAAEKLPPGEHRNITLTVFSQEDFVLLRVENPFDGTLQRRGGALVSRKPDKGHGYGLRNIAATAESYGGSMTVDSADGWFTLSVLLPR